MCVCVCVCLCVCVFQREGGGGGGEERGKTESPFGRRREVCLGKQNKRRCDVTQLFVFYCLLNNRCVIISKNSVHGGYHVECAFTSTD